MLAAPPLASTDCDMHDRRLPAIRGLEAIAARSWPSRETVFDGTWAVRLCDHDTKRQNSIVPLDPHDAGDLDARIAAAQLRFLRAERRPTFRLTPLAHAAIDATLEARRWTPLDRTHVMTVDLAAMPNASPGETETCRHRWVDALARMNGVEPPRASGLARTIERIERAAGPTNRSGPARLHILRQDDEPVAAALAVQLGRDVGLMEVFARADRRGQGLGRRVVTEAMTAARLNGARRAWLQVAADNAPAVTLYRSMGFATLYDYHYRVAPTS